MGRERGDCSWTRRGSRGEPVPQFRCSRARREQCGSRSREHLFRCEAEGGFWTGGDAWAVEWQQRGPPCREEQKGWKGARLVLPAAGKRT